MSLKRLQSCYEVSCGVAGAALSLPAYIAAIMLYLSRHTPPIPPGVTGEVAWDVISIVHHGPVAVGVWRLAAFAVGFLVGFRYFSKKTFPQAL